MKQYRMGEIHNYLMKDKISANFSVAKEQTW